MQLIQEDPVYDIRISILAQFQSYLPYIDLITHICFTQRKLYHVIRNPSRRLYRDESVIKTFFLYHMHDWFRTFHYFRTLATKLAPCQSYGTLFVFIKKTTTLELKPLRNRGNYTIDFAWVLVFRDFVPVQKRFGKAAKKTVIANTTKRSSFFSAQSLKLWKARLVIIKIDTDICTLLSEARLMWAGIPFDFRVLVNSQYLTYFSFKELCGVNCTSLLISSYLGCPGCKM